MTNIIFLDVDGPLLPGKAYFHPKNEKDPWSFWDPIAVSLVNNLRKEINAKYVLSSTWAIRDNIFDILTEQGIDPEHFHTDWKTPRKLSSARVHEISMWLDDHPETTKWIAIDDGVWNSSFDEERLKNGLVIEVDFDEGFTFKNYREALNFFGIEQPLILG